MGGRVSNFIINPQLFRAISFVLIRTRNTPSRHGDKGNATLRPIERAEKSARNLPGRTNAYRIAEERASGTYGVGG